MLYVRSEQKKYGVGGLIEGGLDGTPAEAIIVDDAIGTGATVNRAEKELRSQGIEAIGVVCVALMGAQIEPYLANRGMPLSALTDYDQILIEAERQDLLDKDSVKFMRDLYERQGVVDEY
jgi:orotate phosphoribosyltransferase